MRTAQQIPARTIFCENGEANLVLASGGLVLDAFEETPTGRDRVHVRKASLILSRKDAREMRKAIDEFLREPPAEMTSAASSSWLSGSFLSREASTR